MSGREGVPRENADPARSCGGTRGTGLQVSHPGAERHGEADLLGTQGLPLLLLRSCGRLLPAATLSSQLCAGGKNPCGKVPEAFLDPLQAFLHTSVFRRRSILPWLSGLSAAWGSRRFSLKWLAGGCC